MHEYIVHKQISISASQETVWDALTNPEKTKKYFFHCKVYSDWKPGSRITFKGRIFLIKKIEMQGTIINADPGKLLHYTLRNGDGKTTSVVKDELSFENGRTLLTVTDDVGDSEGAEKRFKRSEKGWDKILKGLKHLLES